MSKEMYPFFDTEGVGRRFYQELGDGLERVSQDTVLDAAIGIGESYQLPEQLVAQGISIPVFRATGDTLMEAERREAAHKKIPLDVDEESLRGVTLSFTGTPVILVLDSVEPVQLPLKLGHELIHGMVPLETDKSKNLVNEAVVSVLEAARRNRYVPFYEPRVSNRQQQTLYGKVFRGEEGLSYFHSAYRLMILMAATHFGEYPFEPQDLARHYFGEKSDYQLPLRADLFVRIPENLQGTVKPYFNIFSSQAA